MAVLSVDPNERVSFKVRYADEHLLVVDKPTHVVTQPGVGHEHDTLLNGLFARYGQALQQLGRDRDFGLVHRLDRETSGLVAVGLSAEGYDGLRRLFARREMAKFYWAVCVKSPREKSGVIRKNISEVVQKQNRYTSTKFARLDPRGEAAVTAYRVLAESELASLIEARPVTGKLHQVRVHLASVGAGILGDDLYGPRRTSEATARLALHAHRLKFVHPVTGAEVDVRSPWPRDLRRVLREFGLAEGERAQRETGVREEDEGGDEVGGAAD